MNEDKLKNLGYLAIPEILAASRAPFTRGWEIGYYEADDLKRGTLDTTDNLPELEEKYAWLLKSEGAAPK